MLERAVGPLPDVTLLNVIVYMETPVLLVLG